MARGPGPEPVQRLLQPQVPGPGDAGVRRRRDRQQRGAGGRRRVPGMAAYVAAKHGVVGLTRAAALECAGQGVRVNALVTGNVDTPLFRGLLGAPADGELEVAGMNPAGRVARPDEIAAFVAFLLSDEAAFITGAALAIDGGFTAQ